MFHNIIKILAGSRKMSHFFLFIFSMLVCRLVVCVLMNRLPLLKLSSFSHKSNSYLVDQVLKRLCCIPMTKNFQQHNNTTVSSTQIDFKCFKTYFRDTFQNLHRVLEFESSIIMDYLLKCGAFIFVEVLGIRNH